MTKRKRREVSLRGDGIALACIVLGFAAFWILVSVVNAAQQHRGPRPAPVQRETGLEPAPLKAYFNDEAQLLGSGDQQRFERLLADFDKETSSQIAVAVFRRSPAMPIEDFTIATATQSQLGHAGRDNGAILFLFLDQRVARLEVGYGLESTLTDAMVRRILDEKLLPPIRSGNYSGALDGTLTDILATIHDDYKSSQKVTFWNYLKIAGRKSKLEISRTARNAWSSARSAEPNERIGVSVFGTVFVFLFWTTLVNSALLIRAVARSLWQAITRRPLRTGMDKVDFEPIEDSIKLAFLLLVTAGGGILMAAGGTFGGAGGQIHW